jgi:hypothetical protein
MGLFSKDIGSMDDLFIHRLQDIYYAEKRIVGALPDMIAKATPPELKSAFEAHLGADQKPRQACRAGLPDAWSRAETGRLSRDRRHHRGGG